MEIEAGVSPRRYPDKSRSQTEFNRFLFQEVLEFVRNVFGRIADGFHKLGGVFYWHLTTNTHHSCEHLEISFQSQVMIKSSFITEYVCSPNSEISCNPASQIISHFISNYPS
jgi:hypothetical protein